MQAPGRRRASLGATGCISDARLVARARRGDAVAFDELVGRHLPSVYAVTLRKLLIPEAAAAACQDAFLRALDELDRCTDPARFLPWLLQIARQCATDARMGESPPCPPAMHPENPQAHAHCSNPDLGALHRSRSNRTASSDG